ncbi:hypothetical protein DTW91_08605 [Chryseobacterium sp. SC28]|nr:hypothetical protein DTW91_08605 [Chryseobacterium sp. SC28]
MDIENLMILQLRDSIFELEDKSLIQISNAEFYLVRVYNKADQRENDYYMLPSKPSFVPFANNK